MRFLREINVVDDNAYVKLFGIVFGQILENSVRKSFTPQSGYAEKGAEPTLRSGLYILRSFVSTVEERAYVLYWPEATTWDDQAISTVRRNRVMFMRYDRHCARSLPQFNCTHIGTSPNYVIRSSVYSRQNIQKQLCGATRTAMTHRMIQITTTRTGFMTSSLRRRMIKRRTWSRDLDSRYISSRADHFRVSY